jgi:SAM-dependent methyltransferase
MYKKFLNLGLQPLANSYLNKKNLNKKEQSFKLEVGVDMKNFLVSIINTVPKTKMFNQRYPYKSSASKTMKSSFLEISKKIKKIFNPNLIVEIGSNDGAFIKNFERSKSIGVEPCKNLARITKKNNYRTFSEFWNCKLARKIIKFGKADVIYSANTLSHIKDLNEIFRAINIVLNEDGVLIIEDPSLLECLKSVAYDQFYCEHIYVFSSLALKNVLQNFNLIIFNIENTKTHGGSNRYYIKKSSSKKNKINSSVNNEINKEIKFGLKKFSTYKKFEKKVSISKIKLVNIIKRLKNRNFTIIGYGATAKSCTVLNYCKIGTKLIDYFYDTTPNKINKYLPGSKIKVKKYKELNKKNVDFAYLGAWNFKKEIFKKEKKFLLNGGKFITHVPYPKII